jgi:hypothetical protein
MSGRLRLRPWPWVLQYTFVPLRQVEARPTHYNSELSLCSSEGHSYVAVSKVFMDGMVQSGAHYQRDALSKERNIQDFRSGTHPSRGRDNIADLSLLWIRLTMASPWLATLPSAFHEHENWHIAFVFLPLIFFRKNKKTSRNYRTVFQFHKVSTCLDSLASKLFIVDPRNLYRLYC